MTSRDLQNAFEYEVNKYDSPEILTSHLVFYWINAAIHKYVEEAFKYFEQHQSITDDLNKLIVESVITTAQDTIDPYRYLAAYPLEYLHALSEKVAISYPNPNDPQQTINSISTITNAKLGTLTAQLSDPYSTYRLHYEKAKPLRIFGEANIELYTDGNYTVDSYILTFLKVPDRVDLDNDLVYLPDSTHYEIVRLAVQMYLQSIGIQAEPTKESAKI